MNLKIIVRATLLYLACFVSALLLLIRGFIVWSVPPRQAAVVLFLFLVVAAVFARVLIRRAARSSKVPAAGPADPVTRKQRMFAIRAVKVWITLLFLGLVAGLSRAKNFPVWETLGAVVINLTMTASLIWLVVRLQRSLK